MKAAARWTIILLASILLMAVALYNGYPLVENDTGAYIESGVRNLIPRDRSPYYSWFIRYTSMWSSLWYTVFAQCLLTAWLLYRYIVLLLGNKLQVRMVVTVFVMVTAFTTIPWVTCYLMPDIFGGILLLAGLLFLADRGAPRYIAAIYGVLTLAATVIHNAHAAILFAFAVVLLVYGSFTKMRHLVWRSSLLLLFSVVSWAVVSWTNALNGYDFTFSRGSHVFMVTKFAESGILEKYLHEQCDKKQLKLCRYKDSIPDYSWDFLWADNSPLYLTGGWDSNKAEYGLIIHDVLTTPTYAAMYAGKAASSTARQLSQIQAPLYTTLKGQEWSSASQRIRNFYEDEWNEYLVSRQYTTGMSAVSINYVYFLVLVLSTVWVLIHRNIVRHGARFLYAAIVLFLLVNAFVTATGSTVIYRYTYRVVWLVPATNLILMAGYYYGLLKDGARDAQKSQE